MAILRKDTLRIIMVGATHVIDMGGKTAFIHYETEETAHMLLPDGTRFDGSWSLLDDGYRVEWTNGPTGSWKLDYNPGAIDYVDCDRRRSRPRLAHRVRRGRTARRRDRQGLSRPARTAASSRSTASASFSSMTCRYSVQSPTWLSSAAPSEMPRSADQRHAEELAGAQHGEGLHVDHVGGDRGVGGAGNDAGAGRQRRLGNARHAQRQRHDHRQIEEWRRALLEAERRGVHVAIAKPTTPDRCRSVRATRLPAEPSDTTSDGRRPAASSRASAAPSTTPASTGPTPVISGAMRCRRCGPYSASAAMT